MTPIPRSFVSTAIPFVNSRPHLGFAYEAVLGDVLARHARRCGRATTFVTGSDEHSLKNVLAAERAGVSVAELVAANADRFRALREPLALSTDAFVRTSEARHRAAVLRLWSALERAGDLYRAPYEGRYCAGCERFVDEGEERCPEHPHEEPELVREENWFFRASRYGDVVVSALEQGALRVEPEGARREALALARAGVRDVSVSRSASRARGWAIEVPGDPSQVIWVWLDALTSYLTAVGYGDDDAGFDERWRRAEQRVHVVGKGIARFHSALWPALLSSAGEPLPTCVFVHGYVTVEGRKISKSGEAAIDPLELVASRGVDALRWFLLRHLPTDHDGDFTIERFEAAHDADLADQLGNLVQRTLALVHRDLGGVVPREVEAGGELERELVAEANALASTIEAAVARFAIDEALGAIAAFVRRANAYADRTEPWALAKRGERAALERSLHHLAEAVRVVAITSAPFVPGIASGIAQRLGASSVAELGAPRLGAPAAAPVRLGPPIVPRIAAP